MSIADISSKLSPKLFMIEWLIHFDIPRKTFIHPVRAEGSFHTSEAN